MGSPSWIVVCEPEVDHFRQTLSPEEAELFNECLTRICSDPHVDKVHKFWLFTRMPLVDILYRDDNFVLIYNPTQVNSPIPTRKITVLKATRVRDLDEWNAVPRR